MWVILKRYVKKKINKLVVKKESITIDIFIDTIKKKWERIEFKILLNLVCNIPKRLEQVIKSNGNKISY